MTMSPTISAKSAATVELEMDMEVKSEPESDDENINSNISDTSSIKEVMKPGHFQSDEELEEEPLIEIESVMVPQELVKDEFEPSLLLFVNRDPKKLDPIQTNNYHQVIKKNLVSTDEKCTQTDSVKEISITKVLRSVKRKQTNNLHKNPVKETKNKPKVLNKRTYLKYLLDDPETSLSGYSADVDPSSTTVAHKRKLSLKSQKKKHCLSKLNPKTKRRTTNSNEQSIQVGQGSPENLVTNESRSNNRSCSSENSEEETDNFVKGSKGKENTQCNNEDITRDAVLNSSQCDLKSLETNSSVENKIDSSKPLKPNSYDCTVCGKQFKEKSHLATHSRAHNDTRNFKCNECGLLFKTKTNLYFHTKTHSAPFNCLKCNKTFLQKKMFTRHMRVVHSGEGLYNCDICGRPFKSAQHLELHYTLHTGNKPFSCDVCNKTFVYKSTYRAHMKAHEADEQFDCEVCLAAGLQDKGELRRRCNHYSQARPWLCTICGKAYPLKSTLKNHMKSHDAEKQFKCEECGKYFMKKQTYEIHLKKHTGEKPEYMCDQCSQSYHSYVSLKRHYMKHTGQRNFVCDLCNKAFWTKDAMKVHRISHENVKRFQCSQCSKAFAHKQTLVAHTRTHTGTQHSCEICYKTFAHKCHLIRHTQKHNDYLSSHPQPLPLNPSLYPLYPPHNHLPNMPTLQIL